MKKLLNFLLVFLLSSALFAGGCFFTKNEQGGDDNIEKEAFELDPNKEYYIEFMMWGAADEVDNYTALVDSFMDEYENVTVNITPADSTQYMSILTGKLSGKMPDLFYLPEYEFRPWVDAGRLLSVTNGFTEEEYAGLWSTAVDWYSYNRATKQLGVSEGSDLYCLPKDIGPWTLMYNADMAAEMVEKGRLTEAEAALLADSDKALTWKQFTDICVKVQNYFGVEKKNDKFYAVPYYELSSAIWSNNADYFDEGAMNSAITSDEFVETAEWLWDLMWTYGVVPKSTGDTAQNMFLAENCMFCWVGPYLTPMYAQQKMNYRLMPVPYNGDNPAAKSTTWIGTLGLAVSKTTEQPAAALALMKYLSLNEKAQKDFYTRGQLMPNLKSMALDTETFLSEDDPSVALWPDNRYVYCDIVDGFGGDTKEALGKEGADVIGGRVRPHYYTFENSWLTALETEMANIYALKDRSLIRGRLEAFDTTMQAYLDRSNASAGITNK